MPAARGSATVTEERPAHRFRPVRREDAPAVSDDAALPGWSGGDEKMTQGAYAKQPQVDPGESFVFKFLEDAPYSNVRIHWIKRGGKTQTRLCIGAGCPLCDIGVETSGEHRFNIAMLTDGGAVVRSLHATKMFFNELKNYNKDPKYGPLTKCFYERTRPTDGGKGGKWKTHLYRRDADIAEDYPDLVLPDQDELDELDKYTLEDTKEEMPSRADLQGIADELSGDYNDD